jgi:hypothetical protein
MHGPRRAGDRDRAAAVHARASRTELRSTADRDLAWPPLPGGSPAPLCAVASGAARRTLSLVRASPAAVQRAIGDGSSVPLAHPEWRPRHTRLGFGQRSSVAPPAPSPRPGPEPARDGLRTIH